MIQFIKDIFNEPYIPESNLPILRPRGQAFIAVFVLGTIIALVMVGLFAKSAAQIVSIAAFAIGALLWFTASVIPTPLPLAYLDGPPDKVINRAKWQARCNALGAASTAIALVAQITTM